MEPEGRRQASGYGRYKNRRVYTEYILAASLTPNCHVHHGNGIAHSYLLFSVAMSKEMHPNSTYNSSLNGILAHGLNAP